MSSSSSVMLQQITMQIKEHARHTARGTSVEYVGERGGGGGGGGVVAGVVGPVHDLGLSAVWFVTSLRLGRL